jgi:hypothetical protein
MVVHPVIVTVRLWLLHVGAESLGFVFRRFPALKR